MSIWLDSCKLKIYEKLNKDINCDVCIVGGGITGISRSPVQTDDCLPGYVEFLPEPHS